MPVPTTATLGDLVTEDPRRARVLEAHGLDYCCGGARSLAQAAQEAGVDLAAVSAALDLPDPGPAPEWQSLDPAELTRHLVDTHHAYLWAEMSRLQELVDKVAHVHGANHPELAAVRDLYLAAVADLGPHLLKEERILFPAIVSLVEGDGEDEFCFATLSGPIRQMLAEHDTVGDLFAQLRERTGGYAMPADGCASYKAMLEGLAQMEADTHEHIHKENNVLFPRVLELEHAGAGA